MSNAVSQEDASQFETPEMLGRSLIPLVLLLFGISLVATVGLLSSAFDTLDRQARGNLHKLVNTGLSVHGRHQENIVNEYSHWEEGHRRFVREAASDPASADMLAGYVFNHYAFDLVGVVRAEPVFQSIWLHGQPVANRSDMHSGLDPAIHQEIKKRVLASPETLLSTYVTIKGKPYIASFGSFRDEVTANPVGDQSILMFAKRLDDPFFERIGDAYQVSALKMTDPSGPVELALRDLKGQALVHLTWSKPGAGQLYIDRLLGPVVAIFVVMTGLVYLLLMREKRNRTQYVNQLIKFASKDFLTGASNRREFFYQAVEIPIVTARGLSDDLAGRRAGDSSRCEAQTATARACSARSDWRTSCRPATRCARSESG